MSHLYFQLNIVLAISFLIFHFLPLKNIRYTLQTILARSLLLISFSSVAISAALPDNVFSYFSSSVQVLTGKDLDSSLFINSKILNYEKNKEVISNEISTATNSNLFAFLPFIFFLGMMAMIVQRASSWLRLGRLLQNTIVIHRIGKTLVVVSDEIKIPFSTLFKGCAYVVLPSELLISFSDFRIALRHEVQHHRRRDTRWTMIFEGLVCLFYLNPFVYLWRKKNLELQELACDEVLISQMGISSQDYGRCLLRVAEMALGYQNRHVGTTCMIFGARSKDHSFLIRRIKMFKHHKQIKVKKSALVLLGTILTAVVFGGTFLANAALRSDSNINAGTPVFDDSIESLTKSILSQNLKKFKSSAGFVIVANPQTGEIITSTNINRSFDKSLKGNWALSYPLQPASAIKPLLIASALQSHVATIHEMHNCENGEYSYGENHFRDYKPFKTLSTADAVIHSSNICTIKVGQKLGAIGLEKGLKNFGLGTNGSAKDFPSAKVGHIPSPNTTSEENYIGFLSQGTSEKTDFYVTPLELVQAYGAIANGGKLMKAIQVKSGQSPKVIRDVLSPQASREVRETLSKVVTSGTAQPISGSSIALAGKTSTTDIDGNRRITGFIGYAPADQPKLVVYVVLFDPRGENRVGSNTAAVVFKEVVEKILPNYN